MPYATSVATDQSELPRSRVGSYMSAYETTTPCIVNRVARDQTARNDEAHTFHILQAGLQAIHFGFDHRYGMSGKQKTETLRKEQENSAICTKIVYS